MGSVVVEKYVDVVVVVVDTDVVKVCVVVIVTVDDVEVLVETGAVVDMEVVDSSVETDVDEEDKVVCGFEDLNHESHISQSQVKSCAGKCNPESY